MKVEKKVIDNLNAEVVLTIEQDDYLPQFNKKLNSYRDKAHMKGFRKGKTPLGMVKKMYGASTMQEVISELLSEQINKLITGDEFNIIGEPLLVDQDNLPEIDHKNPQDYTYKFELGLEPEFDVKGIAEEDSYILKEVDIDDKMIDEEIANIKKQLGEQKSTDKKIQEDDIIKFSATELDGKKIKENGYTTEFTANIDKLTSQYQKELKSKKKGDKIVIDIYNFEEGMSEEQVQKYLLKLKENDDASEVGNQFEAEITDVTRVEPAEFDKEAFDKYFGKDEVKTEDEAREKIKGYLADYFNQESQNLLSREIMDALVEKNEFDLPREFLKKWITREKEVSDEDFEGFTKELKWRIIKKKLVDKFKVEVKEEEILTHFVNAIRNYSPYIDEATLKNTAFSLMQNREQVNTAVENISSGKLFDAIKEVVKINSKKISKDKFTEIVKQLNQKAN